MPTQETVGLVLFFFCTRIAPGALGELPFRENILQSLDVGRREGDAQALKQGLYIETPKELQPV